MRHRIPAPRSTTSTLSHIRATRPLRNMLAIFAVLAMITVGTACDPEVVPVASPYTPAAPAPVDPPGSTTTIVTTPACWTTLPIGKAVTTQMWNWFVFTLSGSSDPANHRCDPNYPHLPNSSEQAFPSQTTLRFAPGTTTVGANTQLKVSSMSKDFSRENVVIDGTGATIKQAAQHCSATTDDPPIMTGSRSTSMFVLEHVEHVTMKHLTIVGGNANAPDNYNESCGSGHGIQVYGDMGTSSDVTIYDTSIKKTWGDSIYLNAVNRVRITDNKLEDSGRESIGVMNYTSDIKIDNNKMFGAGYRIGVDVEPNNVPVSAGDTAFGSRRVAISKNTTSGMTLAAFYISAHQQPDEGEIVPPITITDVLIDRNTSLDTMVIRVAGKPYNPDTESIRTGDERLAERLISGDVRRVQVSGNASTGTNALIVVSGSTYATVTNNTAPEVETEKGTIDFPWRAPAFATCFWDISGNTGYVRSADTPPPSAALPPNSLSIDQLVTRLASNQSGIGRWTTRDLVKTYEWKMCQGSQTASGVAQNFTHEADPALHNTSYADRLAMVLDQWWAATGELPPTAALATAQAKLDPGSTVLSGSPAALTVAASILEAHPELTTVTNNSFLTTVLTNGFGEPPSNALLASASQTLASGKTRQQFLAGIGSFSSGGRTVQATLQTGTDFVTLSLSITASLPTLTKLVSLALSGTTQDQYATELLNGPKFAALPPFASTPGT